MRNLELRIGTRNSKLALIQAYNVAAELERIHVGKGKGLLFPISTHKVQGDADKSSPFLKLARDISGDAAKSLWTLVCVFFLVCDF